VVFSHDEGAGPEDNVKRVIGLPGDHIRMDGLFPIINGWPVPSCNVGPYAYVSAGARATGRMRVEWLDDRAYLVLFGLSAPELEREYVVGPNEVFVLGDNRSDSLDSRTYNSGFGGGADLGAIEGRVDWFLSERKNNGDASFKRLFSRLGTDFTLEGVTIDELKTRIQSCFAKRPSETRPPPPQHLPSATLEGPPQ
jgi:signal peptidase I